MNYKEKKYLSIGRKEREKHKMTVPQVVEELKKVNIHVNKQTLYNYENGSNDMPLSIFIALANIYDCDFNDLIYPIIVDPIKVEPVPYEVYGYNKVDKLYYKNKYKNVYQPDANRIDDIDQMYHVIFDIDDIDTGFLKNTRLIYRKTGDFKFKISSSYNYYFISKIVKIDGKDITRGFFTKAKFIKNSVTPRIVQYFYNGQVEHIAEKQFLEMVEGIVVKVIYDRQMKKTEGAFFY